MCAEMNPEQNPGQNPERNPEASAITVVISGRLRPLLSICQEVFSQPTAGLARPLGLAPETCQIAAELCRRWLGGEMVVEAKEVPALLSVMEFARRELAAEFHTHLAELQKSMTAIITARTTREIERAAIELPKQAEQATRRLREALKQRGELLDECEMIIKRVRNQSGLALNK
jgi:hypothetical protein